MLMRRGMRLGGGLAVGVVVSRVVAGVVTPLPPLLLLQTGQGQVQCAAQLDDEQEGWSCRRAAVSQLPSPPLSLLQVQVHPPPQRGARLLQLSVVIGGWRV